MMADIQLDVHLRSRGARGGVPRQLEGLVDVQFEIGRGAPAFVTKLRSGTKTAHCEILSKIVSAMAGGLR